MIWVLYSFYTICSYCVFHFFGFVFLCKPFSETAVLNVIDLTGIVRKWSTAVSCQWTGIVQRLDSLQVKGAEMVKQERTGLRTLCKFVTPFVTLTYSVSNQLNTLCFCSQQYPFNKELRHNILPVLWLTRADNWRQFYLCVTLSTRR